MKKLLKTGFSSLGLIAYQASTVLAQDGDIVIDEPNTGVPSGKLGNLISNAITVILAIAGLLTFLYLVWGGIQWITSGGDKAQYEEARNKITAALVGLAIVAAAWAVMQLIAQFFGIDFRNIEIPSIRN
jgi:hypothetical protein